MKVIGAEKAAATVFAVIECAPRIRQPAAYFHSLTVGARSKGYRVDRFLDQIYEHGMSTMGNMTAGAGQSHPRMTQAASVM